MNIVFESELMENQKHAVVMAPEPAFEVLQSSDGDALFFSIGTDNVLYLTREVTLTATGWNKIDLSSALSSQHGGAPVVAKTFSVTQNAHTLSIDLALVLTVGGADFLYLSLGNANTDAAWAHGVTWTVIPFDAGTAPHPLTIADVFLMNIPASGGTGNVENLFVDILRTPGDPLKLLDRYYIAPGKSPQWNLHKLAADLAAGSISSCLGQRTGDPIPGIYTFGTINDEQELSFTPQYNYFRPNIAPNPARLTLPTGTSAIASALTPSGVSNLFVAATEGLFVFTPDNQDDNATPVRVVANGLIAGASTLAAATDATRTTVWGVNPQGNLFYVTCPAGSETDSTAWSHPVPLLPSVERFAFFLNPGAGNSVLFAHVNGQNLIQLTQDPVTTAWLQRNILLPTTDPNDVAVYNSYTTHITITDNNGIAAPNAAVAVTATSPVSVYLNDIYHLLSPTVAVNTTADITGILTVVQETQSLAAVCFRVALTDAPHTVADINPMSKALATLGTVHNGDDLSNVQITNADGTHQPLVPAGVSSDDRDAAAQSIAQFMKINAGLLQNGSPQASTRTAGLVAGAPPSAATTSSRVWGISFATGHLEYHEGDDTAQHFGLRTVTTQSPFAAGDTATFQSISSDIDMAAGDFFEWIKQSYDKVEHFVVQEAEGLYHFLATIADKVYDVLLDCTEAVIHAVEFVFNKIKVFFGDLIKWLGFIFEWSDILRTHNVLKSIFSGYLAKCINNLDNTRTQLQHAFTDVENYVGTLTGITNNIPPSLSGASLTTATASIKPTLGLNSPQSNWGLHQLKSNAASGTTTAQPNQGVVHDDIASVLQPLADALEREKEVFQSAYDSFKNNIIDKISDLSAAQITESVAAIIVDALLESVENVLLAAIDVLHALTEGIMDSLNATIDIPVISGLYKKISGDNLSLLDLSCLVAAIPVTIIYKLIADAPPFPDNANTTALINAPDFSSIQKICNPVNTSTADAVEAPAFAASISPSDNNILGLTGGISSFFGAISLSIFSPLKLKYPKIKIYSVICGLSYLPYVTPDIMGQIPDLQNQKWWASLNEAIADLMTAKSMVDMSVGLQVASLPSSEVKSISQQFSDNVSPWIDFAANALWNLPTIAAACDPENLNTAGIMNCLGGICFDANGMLSPPLADLSDPTWAGLVVVAAILNFAYGTLSCGASILTFES